MTQGFAWTWQMRGDLSQAQTGNSFCLFHPACCKGTWHTVFLFISLCPASLIHAMAIFIVLFLNVFYICTNTHLFTWLFPILEMDLWRHFEREWCVWKCVSVTFFFFFFVHKFGQMRGPPMEYGVCSHVLCPFLGAFFISTSNWRIAIHPSAMSAFISLSNCQML